MKRKLQIWAYILVPPVAGITALLIFPETRLGGEILLIAALVVAGLLSFSWGMANLDQL